MESKIKKSNITIGCVFGNLIYHVNVIYNHIRSFWESNHTPRISEIKYGLGYDINDDCDILFNKVLTYLVDHEEIILISGRSSEPEYIQSPNQKLM